MIDFACEAASCVFCSLKRVPLIVNLARVVRWARNSTTENVSVICVKFGYRFVDRCFCIVLAMVSQINVMK